MHGSRLLALVLGSFLVLAHARAGIVRLEYSPQKNPQPLKGIDAGRDREGTFVWNWIRVGNVMTSPDVFDWTYVDERLKREAGRGRHSILRPFLDGWSQDNPVPGYLTNIVGATATDAFGHLVPVYSHAATRDALVRFAEVFGARYDGDPRIGFVEIGLLGQWGEGWAVKGRGAVALEVTPETRDAVHDAYQRSFRRTRLLMPGPATNAATVGFGYHDDAFAFWKLPDSFRKRLVNADPDALARWRQAPVNGRIHPEFAKDEKVRYLDLADISEDRLAGWIRREHYSCIRMPEQQGVPYVVKDRFVKAARGAGYEFHVRRAEWQRIEAGLKIRVTMTNSGVAPFYYAWPVELAWMDGNGVARNWPVDWEIRRLIPGDGDVVYETTLDPREIPPVGATLAMRIPNALSNGPPIRFANREQDRDVDGWLSLGVPGSGR